uniref:Uncharacterized protein n=1 Tax=Candidatus Kentrum sp. FW TaxID=2126338 RepID=A0A450SRD0_9GAMM|nr:MAG: hypothetical protein BECKFW1821B_GA0114236_102736 [Candidatus Kentron sp. FW]
MTSKADREFSPLMDRILIDAEGHKMEKAVFKRYFKAFLKEEEKIAGKPIGFIGITPLLIFRKVAK